MTADSPRPASPTVATWRSHAVELVLYWGVVVAWMIVISGLSTEPFSAQNTNRYIDPVLRLLFPRLTPAEFLVAHTVIRKTAHFAEFFILGGLIFWAARRGRQPRWHRFWMAQAVILGAVYALLDEAHQAFVAHRTASLIDSGVDWLGAVASQLWIYARHLRRARIPADR